MSREPASETELFIREWTPELSADETAARVMDIIHREVRYDTERPTSPGLDTLKQAHHAASQVAIHVWAHTQRAYHADVHRLTFMYNAARTAAVLIRLAANDRHITNVARDVLKRSKADQYPTPQLLPDNLPQALTGVYAPGGNLTWVQQDILTRQRFGDYRRSVQGRYHWETLQPPEHADIDTGPPWKRALTATWPARSRTSNWPPGNPRPSPRHPQAQSPAAGRDRGRNDSHDTRLRLKPAARPAHNAATPAKGEKCSPSR